MRITFANLNRLSNLSLKKVLKALGIEPTSNYLKNKSLVAKAEALSEFNGRITEEALLNYANNNANFLNDIQPNLYTHQAVPKEVRKEMYEALPKPNLYTHTSTPKEVRKEMYEALPKPGVYTRQSTPKEVRKARFDKVAPAVMQLKNAKKVIDNLNSRSKKVKKSFSFDVSDFNADAKEYFNSHLGSLLLEFLNNVNLTEEWICNYSYDNQIKAKVLTPMEATKLVHQLKTEDFISQAELDTSKILESNYDFFDTDIQNLQSFQFLEINDNPDVNVQILKGTSEKIKKKAEKITSRDKVYQALLKSGDKEAIKEYITEKYGSDVLSELVKTKQYLSRNGQFWKYTLNIPVNLERFQIFNKVTKETSELMTRDNCLIYAAIQAGVDEVLVDRMREIIRIRAFPQSKLQDLADELGITFIVKIVKLNETKTANGDECKIARFRPTTQESTFTLNLLLIDGHYLLNERLPMSTFFIKHYDDIIKNVKGKSMEWMMKVVKCNNGVYKSDSKKTSSIEAIIKACFASNRFDPITIGSITTYSSILFKEDLPALKTLEYSEKYCTKLKTPVVKESKSDSARVAKKRFVRYHVVYADFECSTDGECHKAFNLCYSSPDIKGFKGSLWGENCAIEFLDRVPNGTQIYFHNLSYDINFILNKLDKCIGDPVIKSSKTFAIEGEYKGKRLLFKDSYTIISKKLSAFPEMFKLETGPKEVFPYDYYTSELLESGNRIGVISEALNYVTDVEAFVKNVNSIKGCKLSENTFDLERYSTYYCEQDCRILQQGFERFRSDLLKEFNLDAYDFVSISSIADEYFEENVYYKNGNLYNLANTPREFISRCVQGGRCMLNSNVKQINVEGPEIVDFDAVSLYPSAIARLYTLEGVPKVIPENWSAEYLLEHLFDDDQTEPTATKFISGFYVEVVIESIGKARDFPLIVVNEAFNPGFEGDRSSNTCCTMYADHITLQDLIKFQQCSVKVVRGYYYDGKRDLSIRNEIRKLFELRLKYKKEGNPLQEIIKLLLNSVYGKTILKPIDTKYKVVNDCDAMRFLRKNYNSILEFDSMFDSDKTVFKCIKPIVRHYNFCCFGVNILSMSKRIMNEVFSTAEDAGMHVFYQDTDSLHLFKKDIPQLRRLYNAKYQRELIGKDLGQFHSDFAEVDIGHESTAVKSIFVGKKSYIDMLTNDLGSIAFHCRLKGITQDVIAITANELYPDAVQCYYDSDRGLFIPLGEYCKDSEYSVMMLYRSMYDGDEVEFDLCKGRNPCFERNKNFTVVTKRSFIRKLRFE